MVLILLVLIVIMLCLLIVVLMISGIGEWLVWFVFGDKSD